MQTPSTCSHSPASSFPVLRKAGQGPVKTRQRIRLGAQVSEIWRVIKTRMLLHGFDEVNQLLHEVGQLLYEVHLLTASGGVAGRHKSLLEKHDLTRGLQRRHTPANCYPLCAHNYC